MKLPKELTTVTPVSKTLAIVLFITLPIIAFFFGMDYQQTLNVSVSWVPLNQKIRVDTSHQGNNPFASYVVKNTCSYYGEITDKTQYLMPYVVKSGDTLLSVAATQLGSSGRIGDIVYLNRDQYPGLSIDKPFLNPGWTLYLPPSYIPTINTIGQGSPELPFAWGGELAGITSDGQWVLRGSSQNNMYTLRVDNNTKFFGKTKNEFKTGDCIKAVLEGESTQVYAVYYTK